MNSRIIFVASGVSSNLFASCFIPLFEAGYIIYAMHPRNKTKEINGITYVSSLEEAQIVPHCILWFSTHDDHTILEMYASTAPTLAISSGAVTSYLQGKQAYESLNAYQKSKVSVLSVPNITVFIPGFFLEDAPLPAWSPSKGLHGDTTQVLFANELPKQLDWNKCYSVTPKSYIVKAVCEWVQAPSVKRRIAVCSDREYYRWELRAFAGLDMPVDVAFPEPKLDPIYKDMDHILPPISADSIVSEACIKTAKLIQ